MVPDYYAMLGVDPGANRASVEAALARKQPIWSSGTRNPKNKHTYQSYLDLVPALRQTLLGDPATRAAYDAELAAARRSERDQRLDTLQRLVRLRAAKGGLTVTDRDLLRERSVQLGLSAEDLDRLIAPIPTLAEAPVEVDPPDPPADVLDPTMRRQIRVALEHLRRRDLYDALGLPRDAPQAEIVARADAERRRWMHKAQVTAEKTAWLEVVSHAQSHLSSAPARRRYDRTLALEAEEVLGGSIEFALKGLPRLDPATKALLIDEAAALGIAPERAETLIGRACRALGVARDGGAAGSTSPVGPVRLLRCRTCGGVTEFAQAARAAVRAPECRHCGAPLRWECPICHKVRWVDEARCACGFRVELREPLVRHFEAAQHAYKARDLEAALAHLRRIQEFAPNHVGTRKAIERIGQRQAEIDQARAAVEIARAGGKLRAAGAALQAWGRLVGAGHPEFKEAWAQVARGLREAEALAARARGLERTDPKAARALYRQSLALAADLPEPHAGLLRCPPDGPTALVAELAADRVRLHWTPPEPDGLGPLTFVVLRKVGGAIEHIGDGSRIAEVAAAEFDDTAVLPGETVSYAVLSKRGAAESITAAAVTPMLLLGDVTDVRVQARSRAVDLSWTLPRGAFDVRVVRKRGGAPTGPKDGEPIDALRDRAHDHGLDDDHVYHYGLFALYRLPDGRLVPSRGVIVSAQPTVQVVVPAAPTLTSVPGGRLRLDWPAPVRGMVQVLRTTRPLPRAAGDRLTPAEAEMLEGHWLDIAAPDHAVDPSPPAVGVCHYTPLIAWGGMLTVGHAVAYSCIADPSDLRAMRVGNSGRVHLRWRWSPQATQALIVARAGTPATGPDDPEALTATIHEVEYSRQGHTTLTLPSRHQGPWHIRVYSAAAVDGARVVSAGLEPSAQTVVPGPNPEVTVTYTIRRRGLLGRPWLLTFRTDPAGADVPPTALVAHPRTVPLSVDDGEIVAHFPATHDGATFPIPADLSRRRARIFADPHVAPDSLPPIRLRHPETDATRV